MIFWTLLISLGTIIGDVFIKRAAENSNSLYLSVGMLLYLFDALLWFWVYKSAKFSTVAIIYSLFTIFLSVAIGIFYFKEQLGIKEVIGLVLGFLSVILLGGFV